MNKRQKQVFLLLKKKAQSLGFNRSELESVAVSIADNLNLADDASDEDVDSAIEDAVDNAMPLLQLSQRASSRVIKDFKNSQKGDENNLEEGEGDDNNNPDPKSKKNTKPATEESETTKLLKALNDKLDAQAKEISELKQGKVTDTRKSKLEALVKDTGTFGSRTLRNFNRMAFKDDDDFEDYLDQIKDDLEKENQERAKQGLSKLGVPPTTGGTKKETEEEPDSDDDIKALAEGIS